MFTFDRLVAFGDSFTYGQELANPNETSYAALVAKKLNVALLNKASPANSNDSMLEQVLELKYSTNDLVIVCFSSINRLHFWDDQGWFSTIRNTAKSNARRNQIINLLMPTLSYDWLYKRYLSQIIYLQHFFELKRIKYLFANTFSIDKEYNTYSEKYVNLTNMINKLQFVGWPYLNFQTAVKDLPIGKKFHPLEDGHELFAQIIFNAIKNLWDVPE